MSLGHFGQYELLRKVGAGGMGELFLARSDGLAGFQKLIVIKRLLPHLSEGPDGQRFVDMFLDEARLAARLNHPNIVQIYDLGKIDDRYYLAMEYVDGVDLRRYLRRGQQQAQALPTEHAVKIASFLCEALHYAHELRGDAGEVLNLVHRDVSPHNVLVSFDGAIKLTDFGIAKATTQVVKTQVGTLKGKLRYMAPEQAEETNVDRRADIFAIGILLYEMLAGKRPFDGVNEFDILEHLLDRPHLPLPNIVKNIPFELSAIVDKALQKDPAGRFQNALEMQMALERFLLQQGLMSNATLIGQHLRSCFGQQFVDRQSSVAEHSGPSAIDAQANVAADFITSATPSYEILGEPSASFESPKKNIVVPTQSVTSPVSADQLLPNTLSEKAEPLDLREEAEQEFGDVFSSVSGLNDSEATKKDSAAQVESDWKQDTSRSILAETPENFDAIASSAASHEIDRTFKTSNKNKGKAVFIATFIIGLLLVMGISWKFGNFGSDKKNPQNTEQPVLSGADSGSDSQMPLGHTIKLKTKDASVELRPGSNGILQVKNKDASVSDLALAKSAENKQAAQHVQVVKNIDAGQSEKSAKNADDAKSKDSLKKPDSALPAKTKAKAKKPGYLTLQTIPWSEIWFGSKKLGLTPLFKHKLPAGRHTLTLKNTQQKIVRKLRINIRPGKTTTRKVELLKLRTR